MNVGQQLATVSVFLIEVRFQNRLPHFEQRKESIDMKKVIQNTVEPVIQENTIYVTIYLKPEIYANSQVVTGSVNWDNTKKKYQTDVNPTRTITGPLSEYGQELEPPISDEYNEFIEDCAWLMLLNLYKSLKYYKNI